jgi:hypothetical protein
MGAKCGKKAVAELATVAKPHIILAWNRQFVNPPDATSDHLGGARSPAI